jgi:glutathione S-transferase
MPAMGALKMSDEKDIGAVTPLLKVLDQQLRGKDYVLGSLTVVDFAIVAYLITKMGRKLDYTECPNVATWLNRMENLKGFVATQVKMPPVEA